LPKTTEEEYRRIPWIWRVSIAAGKRNDADELRKLFDFGLPAEDGKLTDWQAVVIGGGLINGISQQGAWPKRRLAELMKDNAGLVKRWERSLALASKMADDEKVPTGTRYDALRMLGADTWQRRGKQIEKYLAAGVNDELQMGAVSAATDVDSPEAAEALASSLPGLSAGNRTLAVDGLLRSAARTKLLLDAVEAGKLKRDQLNDAQVKRLREHADAELRARAGKLLGE
jgi:hypothetical protein